MASFLRFAAFGIVALAGCTGKDPYNPGALVGSFKVTATLKSSTCGATPNPWTFDVKLRHESSTLYWVQGGLPVSGRMDAAAHVAMRSSDVVTLRPDDVQKKVAGCSVTRQDDLEITLPTTDPTLATTFSGSLSYQFLPTPTSECTDQLTAAGGDFDALPCAVSYTLTAERTSTTR